MLSIPVLAVLAALFAYGILGPVVRDGDRFKHSCFFIYRPQKPRRGDWAPAVMKQELGEWRIKHFIGVAVATLSSLLITNPWISAIMVLCGTLVVSSFLRFLAFFDYAGRGAEIIEAERLNIITIRGKGEGPFSDTSVIATGKVRTVDYYEAGPGDYVTYRQGEVARMIHFDDHKNVSPEEVEKRLNRWEWLAKILHRIG